jgi:hypothetical protein
MTRAFRALIVMLLLGPAVAWGHAQLLTIGPGSPDLPWTADG